MRQLSALRKRVASAAIPSTRKIPTLARAALVSAAHATRRWHVSGDGPDPYSEDVSAAWQVVEYMREHGQSVNLNWGEDNDLWEGSWITGGKRYTGFSKSAPLAICGAALAAVEAP